MRKTKIVATVGPACRQSALLRDVITAGADVLRVNASHTNPTELRKWISLCRKAAAEARKKVGILVDLQGPRVRTGKLRGSKPVLLKKDQQIPIFMSSQPGDETRMTTPTKPFFRMLKKGDPILVDNGTIELKVLSVETRKVLVRVISGGMLGENKGINLPNAPVTLPALTAKDLQDIAVAADSDVDFIALSFVRSEEDVQTIKRWLAQRRKDISVIAKIEKPGAVRRILPILGVTDAVMVARGDLGIEMGVEKIPALQKDLIEAANKHYVPVITATQMLESMMERPHPTRAEASDIANAVFDGTDAVMLSGETAIGKYPVEAVGMMAEIIREAERRHSAPGEIEHGKEIADIPLHAITHAAFNAASDIHARAILVYTLSGKTALHVSKLRPACPIITLNASEKISRRLTLLRGVYSLTISHSNSTDAMLEKGDAAILNAKLLKKGDPVIVVSGKQALPGARYMTKIHRIGDH